MSEATPEQIRGLRSFNRTVTAAIGALDESLMATGHPLSEARAIHELARRDATEVAELRAELGLDSGYLSRLLTRLERDELVQREVSPTDARRQVARLTPAGREAATLLDRRADEEGARLLSGLTDEPRERLTRAMGTVTELLGDAANAEPGTVVLRPAGPGDWGWIVHRHGVLYAEQFGWDETFEALVARIVADHVESRDPRTDAAWIAELAGEPVGCVLCVRGDEPGVAKLRLLLVEPTARGHGVGSHLVEECVRFARRAGYGRLRLWTNSPLTSARPIYEAVGFVLVEEWRHHSFGHEMGGLNFELDLRAAHGADGRPPRAPAAPQPRGRDAPRGRTASGSPTGRCGTCRTAGRYWRW